MRLNIFLTLVELKPNKASLPFAFSINSIRSAYDDELPPPAATLTVIADDIDDVTGWSWEQVGQQSRRFHLTQGMGRWVPAGAERNWPLHLAHSIFSGTDNSLTEHLPATLPELADYAKAQEISKYLTSAKNQIDAAINAFPHYDQILTAANTAITQIRLAQQHCPAHARHQVLHRLSQKISQLSRVVRIASGIDVQAVASCSLLRQGQRASVEFEIREPSGMHSSAISYSADLKLDQNWQQQDADVWPKQNAEPTDPYPAEFLPDEPGLPAVEISLEYDGVQSRSVVELVNPLLILPERVLNLSSDKVVVNQ